MWQGSGKAPSQQKQKLSGTGRQAKAARGRGRNAETALEHRNGDAVDDDEDKVARFALPPRPCEVFPSSFLPALLLDVFQLSHPAFHQDVTGKASSGQPSGKPVTAKRGPGRPRKNPPPADPVDSGKEREGEEKKVRLCWASLSPSLLCLSPPFSLSLSPVPSSPDGGLHPPVRVCLAGLNREDGISEAQARHRGPASCGQAKGR